MGAGLFVGMAMSVCLLSNPMYNDMYIAHATLGGTPSIYFKKCFFCLLFNKILLTIIPDYQYQSKTKPR
tara:strand:- start:390 stop:596 length:207 start_codon:yes stop_codon:yes gene_type:complete